MQGTKIEVIVYQYKIEVIVYQYKVKDLFGYAFKNKKKILGNYWIII